MDYNFVIMLTDDFLVERKSRVADGQGGFTYTYTTIGTIKGRLDEAGDAEIIRARQDTDYITHILFTYPGTNILRNDRVTGVGRVLRVVMLATVHEDHPLEVKCEEIDP